MIMGKQERFIRMLWQATEQRRMDVVRRPCLKAPFVLKDGRTVATDGKSLVVFDKDRAPENYSDLPSVEEVLKAAMPNDNAIALDLDSISDPVFVREWDVDEGEWQCFEDLDSSAMWLEDGKVKMQFALSRLGQLKGIGKVSYRLNEKHSSGTFFFDGGLCLIMALLPLKQES